MRILFSSFYKGEAGPDEGLESWFLSRHHSGKISEFSILSICFGVVKDFWLIFTMVVFEEYTCSSKHEKTTNIFY